MLLKLRVDLQAPKGVKPEAYWAYYLYSAIMKKTSPRYAAYLHKEGLKPVSTSLVKGNEPDCFSLNFNIIGQQAVENLLPAIEALDRVYISRHNAMLDVRGTVQTECCSQEEFIGRYYSDALGPQSLTLKHISPCSFKTRNQYAIFPTPELILKSAVQKWNTFATSAPIEDAEMVYNIIVGADISNYNLKSTSYRLKGTELPAFIGTETLKINVSENEAKVFNLLMHFLEYSGLGIKNSLGMGGVQVIR